MKIMKWTKWMRCGLKVDRNFIRLDIVDKRNKWTIDEILILMKIIKWMKWMRGG